MSKPELCALAAPSLRVDGIRHAFFTRAGGVSEGVYQSLNGGLGSNDSPDNVRANRARMAAALGVARGRLTTPFQIHSARAEILDGVPASPPRCDGLATATPGLALGVTGADCGMVLFADEKARVIGAAHAGWKGALGGVLEATLAAMEILGAARGSIRAALGPAIGARSYEVGPEFHARFLDADAASAAFFAPALREGHFLFDLPGFIGARLRAAGVGRFEDLRRDTYAEPQNFFSYRRSVHRGEADYGRLVSAIALTPDA